MFSEEPEELVLDRPGDEPHRSTLSSSADMEARYWLNGSRNNLILISKKEAHSRTWMRTRGGGGGGGAVGEWRSMG